jgi:hypothetical protein
MNADHADRSIPPGKTLAMLRRFDDAELRAVQIRVIRVIR